MKYGVQRRDVHRYGMPTVGPIYGPFDSHEQAREWVERARRAYSEWADINAAVYHQLITPFAVPETDMSKRY